MAKKTNHNVASAIFAQIKGEAGARMDYEAFLAAYGDDMFPEDIAAIQEIHADEANHMLILQAMAKKYDGDISASSDGAQKAISEIVVGIGAKDAMKS